MSDFLFGEMTLEDADDIETRYPCWFIDCEKHKYKGRSKRDDIVFLKSREAERFCNRKIVSYKAELQIPSFISI